MVNHDVKYHLLRNNDDDVPTVATTVNANKVHIYWIVKFIFFVFICTQVLYGIFSYYGDNNYYAENITTIANDHMCSANETSKECQNYFRPVEAKSIESTDNKKIDKQILSRHQLTSERWHPVNGNDDDASTKRHYSSQRRVDETAVNLITTTFKPPKDSTSNQYNKGKSDVDEKYSGYDNDDDDGNYRRSEYSTSTEKQIEGIEKISTIKKSHDIQNTTTTTTTATSESIMSIANYSTEKTLAPNADIAGNKQWRNASEVFLLETTTTTTRTTTKTTTFKPSTTTTKTSTSTIRSPLYATKPIFNQTKHESPSPQPAKSRKYFVNTSHCHMPFIDPLTSGARKFFKPSHTTGCTKDQAIVTSMFDESTQEYILRINYTVVMGFINNSNAATVVDDLLCCYRQIERSGSGSSVDTKFKLLPCTNFHQDFVVPKHINGIIVDCKSKSSNKLLQRDAFSFIHPYNGRLESHSESVSPDLRRMGVVLIGIDSMSRMNFRRNMPKTYKYLVDKGYYELKGYNKVGDNTFPNLMPLLTGYTRSTVNDKCHPNTVGGLDNCNFIWTKYKENGFITAYAEDTAGISTFNYNLKGFKVPPTHYYFHPIALAIEKTMKRTSKAGLVYCVGRRQYGEYIYDYGLDFVKRFRNQSNFGLFWTNSFSHNAYDIAATMDDKMLKYLQEIEEMGILETSVVMFFSDHGRRWGPLLKLPEGFLEERLPMYYISLPGWFKRDYPEFVRNLEVNQARLATPFDIYMTMQHLLHMTVPSYTVTPSYDCPSGQSIFHEIPENRTCTDACIPEAWCTCIPYLVQPTNSAVIKKVTQMILEEMNKYFVTKNLTSQCSELTLNKITRAKLRDQEEHVSNVRTYVIEFSTKPKTKPTTEFSATIDYDASEQRISLNVEDISRQSKYEDTAKCTDDKQAKKYCICKNSLKST